MRDPRIALFAALLCCPAAATATPAGPPPTPPAFAAKSRGRPDVKLDRLDFPDDVRGAHYFKKRLRRILAKETRRADWGAGRGHKIEYRFAITQLKLEPTEDGVLRVRCSAVGRLPGGKSAKSSLTFGGDPKKRNKVVLQVLEIVGRGVVTRLAELERVRRGH
jgi:hypothetical protein